MLIHLSDKAISSQLLFLSMTASSWLTTDFFLGKKRGPFLSNSLFICLTVLLYFAGCAGAVNVRFNDCLKYSTVSPSLYFKPHAVDAVFAPRPGVTVDKTDTLRITVHGEMIGSLVDLNTTSSRFST